MESLLSPLQVLLEAYFSFEVIFKLILDVQINQACFDQFH